MPRSPIKELSDYLQFIKDCKVVFTSDQGRRVLRYLMRKGCVTTPVASACPDESKRNEGAQRLVLSIVKATHGNESEIEQQLEDTYDS